MKQKHWFLITSLVGMLVAVMVISDLTTKSMTQTNTKADHAMSMAEEELGLEGGDTLTGPARALRLARAARQEALDRQHTLNETMNRLNQMNLQDLGADSTTLKNAEF